MAALLVRDGPQHPAGGRDFQALTGTARKLVHRYANPACPPYDCSKDVIAAGKSPLVAIGRYVQTLSDIMVTASIERPAPPPTGTPTAGTQPFIPLSFSEIQESLIHAKDLPHTTTVENVNGEANVITALICHADGKKPTRVCGRGVMKKILKYVK